MKLYFKGEVTSIGKTYIIFEINNIGNIVYVPNVNSFKQKTNIKIFIYEYESEYQKQMYGFLSFDERVLFEDLLSVSGVGPKTALMSIKSGYQKIARAIAQKNIEAISSIKYMGPKTAAQICLELNSKYLSIFKLNNQNINIADIKSTSKNIGFGQKQISYAMNNLSDLSNNDKAIKEAITLISSDKQS